jgi:hypothetical protein
MNKQLREFEKESGLDIYGLGARRDKWEAALEKYAELIVLKCAEIADTAEPFLASDLIKEQFGVKE